MKKLMPFLPVLAFLFVTCTPTHVYKESTNPRYTRPDPRARYHCTTSEDCDRYFEALAYHARLNNEAQEVNLIDNHGYMFQGKMYEKPTAGKMIFAGSVYEPNQNKWIHKVVLEMPVP
jgi:hypothetical protein